jgi:2-polyprenyl-6-methoxyphenol hydroxylase-like FAD-dependent oxidoreductase
MDTDVAIAGAGPTGLMLACELRLAGVDVVVVERLAERTGESRAGGMHSRTLEVLDQRAYFHGLHMRYRRRWWVRHAWRVVRWWLRFCWTRRKTSSSWCLDSATMAGSVSRENCRCLAS